MKPQTIFRANALCLAAGSLGGLAADTLGMTSFRGPEAYLIAAAPDAAIALILTHLVALAVAIRLWRMGSRPGWHLAASAVHALLGTTSLVFGRNLVVVDFFWSGFITVWLHWVFALLHGFSAATWDSRRDSSVAWVG